MTERLDKTLPGTNKVICPICKSVDNFSILSNVYNTKDGHIEVVCKNCYYGFVLSDKIKKVEECIVCGKKLLVDEDDYNYAICKECEKLPLVDQYEKRLGITK